MMASEPPNPRKKRADKLRIGVNPRESQAGTYLLIARLERAEITADEANRMI